MTKFLGSYPDLGNGGARILHPDSQGVALTLAGALAAASAAVSGNGSIGGTLGVTGAATLASTLGVTGLATLSGGLSVGGNVSITGGGDISVDDITADDATFDDVTIDELILTLLKLGTNPASSGLIRLANNQLIKARNAANSADLTLIGTDASNNLLLGSGLTGVLKAVSSVISAATIVNNDVSSSAAITPDKLSGPLFSYLRSATVNNVTGNGTVYTCPFDSAVVSNANVSGGIFTAPAAGKYLLVAHVSMVAGNSSGTQGSVQIVTTGQSFRYDLNPYGSRHTSSGITSAAIAVIASLAASDTAKVALTISGSGSDNASFVGGSGTSSFAGWRVG